MPNQVTIQSTHHQFGVDPGETVLAAALRQHIGLPYGCRSGACGACKGRIISGSVDYGEYQEHALSAAEKNSGKVLLCQAKPTTDLVVAVREIGGVGDIQVRTLPCRVHQIIHAAHDVVILQLKLPVGDRLQYLAGQYIDILLKDGKRRSYSMANAPHQDEFLELHLRNLPGGMFSALAFTQLKERAILRFQGPFGVFFLRESNKPIIFLAGGTGFAPIKSVIEDAFYKKIDRPMVLYWGVRAHRDLYLPDLPNQWVSEHPNFEFVPVLSEPQPEDRWTGRTGLVHQAVLDDFRDLSEYQVYGCGAPVMIEVAHKTFVERGLPDDEFYSDAFTPAVDVRSASS
jgi:CDP-4-dehydro-6-deoxyglucose reductase, E3